ncbi:hypothetical protein [Phyllobacterium sp. YR531]|uniref:hypothetical protein n=1 Tax=Phyllobacterium sp. YR531 TaxID=1144343 RepID=UPI00026F7EEF|nr:hypothetical protein [Phyllobacterium sp. YR531]EJM98927.1 hypothetical protein PMI41_04690 [Phyllobacterium sp. YR531]
MKWLRLHTLGRSLIVFWVFYSLTGQATAESGKLWSAGRYTFSDEMGGFTITGISGKGTRQDPIVLAEEFHSTAPTVLIIRTEQTNLKDPAEDIGILFHLRVEAVNGSGHPWVEFGFELQEQLNVPSDYGDGLSFYQPGDKKDAIDSRGYASFSDDFEPYDRMIFRDGKIDPSENASFGFPIADFTPKRTFYLVQDPRIPSS